MPEDPKLQTAQPGPPSDAVHHVAEAHRILSALQVPLDKHPELARAIDNLELALSILANKTGGML